MKLVFDATFGEPWVVHLRGFFQCHSCPRPRILHLYDIIGEEERDDPIWIPKLKSLGCVIISGDRGRHSRGPARLPHICKQCNVTHILLSDAMHQKATGFERARAIIVLWHEIMSACKDSPGSRYMMQATDGSFTRFALKKL